MCTRSAQTFGNFINAYAYFQLVKYTVIKWNRWNIQFEVLVSKQEIDYLKK